MVCTTFIKCVWLRGKVAATHAYEGLSSNATPCAKVVPKCLHKFWYKISQPIGSEK